jgi:hypothetical protein
MPAEQRDHGRGDDTPPSSATAAGELDHVTEPGNLGTGNRPPSSDRHGPGECSTAAQLRASSAGRPSSGTMARAIGQCLCYGHP